MGLPLRETFTADSNLPWFATVKRPDLFLRQEWAVVMGGDELQSAVNRAGRFGIRYRMEKMIVAGREPVIEIYRRVGGPFEPEPPAERGTGAGGQRPGRSTAIPASDGRQ